MRFENMAVQVDYFYPPPSNSLPPGEGGH